jgi:hypothetical protein
MFGSAENYHLVNTVFYLVNVGQSSNPLKILSSGQYSVLSRQRLEKLGPAEKYHQVNTVFFFRPFIVWLHLIG